MIQRTLTVNIDGTIYPIKDGSFSYTGKLEEQSECSFTVYDENGTSHFSKGQDVTVTDSALGVLYAGYVHTSTENRIEGQPSLYHKIITEDNNSIPRNLTATKVYEGMNAGVIAADMLKDHLAAEGVTANYAIDYDTTQADFATGTHSNTTATSNMGDGCLELAAAGTKVTILEDSTSDFSSGTLQFVTASNGSLSVTASKAIKMQCKQTGIGQANSHTYVKIFQPSGTFTVVSTRYLYYEVWIDPTSPEKKFGVDIVFTDNTTLRDDFTTGEISQNNLSPHPDVDLEGYADQGKWYGRTFSLASFAGKNIAYVSVACEGNKPGTYIGYFRNIQYLNADFSLNQYFFQNTLNVYPPQQLYNQGYASTAVTVVNTYGDVANAHRNSNSYSVSAVGILKSSFISWKAERLDLTDNKYKDESNSLVVKYSIDGGNSFIQCTNNAPLPILPAGSSLSGASIQLAENFDQSLGTNLETPLVVRSLKIVLYPSYAASKSDIIYSASASSVWQNVGTFTNTQVSGLFLQLIGFTRYFDDNTTNNELSSINLYGGKATGPHTDTSCKIWIEKKKFRLFTFNNTQGIARCDFAGQFADGTFEFDVYIDTPVMKPGCVYRTTSTSNYDTQYAYAVEFYNNTIKLQRGSNTNNASDGTRTEIGSASVSLTEQATHRMKVVFSGSSHKIYLDDVLKIDVTDSTFTGAGYVGFRVSNGDPNNGYIAEFDNFGIMKSLTGTWVSNNISLTSAASYDGRSAVYWQDYSLDSQSTDVLVEASVNGGGSYATCTNGEAIPGLTLGQSLSGVNLKFRVTLTTATASSMPRIRYLVARIPGHYSASGTRTASVLSLTNAGTAGSTTVSWNALTPTGTTVAAETSLNGTSYNSVTNGGEIAGITTQPDPTLDTFDTNTSSSYTSTARTGGTNGAWAYDTSNSRISVSGGTNAIFLYNGITTDDIDVMIDLDQADAAGIVWRHTSASNFYELEVFDASSSAGTTNKMRLYKVVSNVKTQIGTDISILFTRGTYRKIRVKMIGTAIDIYFDGELVRSTTDSSLSSAGKIGLFEATGVGRFYNLRIQPVGDNLSGVNVYSKITLTSTDPTVTPQVTDFAVAALHPNIAKGALIPKEDASDKHIADVLDSIANKSDLYWFINQFKEFMLLKRTAIPAPWILQSTDQELKLRPIPTVESSGDMYCNRYIVTGVIDTKSVTQTIKGNGSNTSWALEYPVDSMSEISLNGQPMTFGLKGIETDKDFYYEKGSEALAQDDDGELIQETDELVVTFTGQYRTKVIRNNTGGFPGTRTQAQHAAITGGSGIVTIVEDVEDQNMNLSTATAYADMQLQRRGRVGRTNTFTITRDGLAPGQYLPVFIPEHGIHDASMLITSVRMDQKIVGENGQNTHLYRYYVECTEGPNVKSWQRLLVSTI